jgi:antitoxin MazE
VDSEGSEEYTQCIATEVLMQTKIQKWGNSLGLRIPKALAEQAGVEAGSGVDLSVKDGKLIVRPQRRQRYELKRLLQSVTARNVHKEIETGEPVGREAW